MKIPRWVWGTTLIGWSLMTIAVITPGPIFASWAYPLVAPAFISGFAVFVGGLIIGAIRTYKRPD